MGISPLSTKGSAPKRPMNIHASPTEVKPSRENIACECGVKRVSTKPANADSAAGIMKYSAFSP